MCDELYETRLARMSQATDSPCLALNIQEFVLGLAMKTGTGSYLLTAHSTARRIPRKLLVTPSLRHSRLTLLQAEYHESSSLRRLRARQTGTENK